MLEYGDRHDLRVPVEYMDLGPFRGWSDQGLPGGKTEGPPLKDPQPEPAKDRSDEIPPVTDTRRESEQPKYEITIKGAERLDSPELPELPAE